MAVVSPSSYFQGLTTHTAATDRAVMKAVTGSHEGVVLSGDMAVTQRGSGANMSVDVAAGACFVNGDEAASQGSYQVTNDATLNVAISTANATNPRHDLIVCQVKDAFYSGATNAASISVVTGTAAASPVDPAIPNSAVVLARVQVGASVSSIVNANITDLRPRAAALSALVVCTSSTRPTTNLYNGLTVYETDTFRMMTYTTSTSTWNPPWNLPWGQVAANTPVTSTQTVASGTVSLTGMTVTFTAIAGRNYVAKFVGSVGGTTGNEYGAINFRKGGTAYRQAIFESLLASVQVERTFEAPFTSTGSTTIDLTMAPGLTHSVFMFGSSAVPALLQIYDVGPAANPT